MTFTIQATALALALAGVSLQAGPKSARPGTVSVLYAGSLAAVMENVLGPAFSGASGYEFRGEGQGSLQAARMIRDRLRSPDVFISADAAVNRDLLMGTGNDHASDWYLTFAAGELVLGYSPRSRFRDLFEQAKAGKLPWYQVLTREGMRLGHTDPNLDPKGYRTLFLFALAENLYKKPGLATRLRAATSSDQIYPEPELLLRLESGQIDAAVFYRHEVLAHHLPFVELPDEVNQSNPRFARLYAAQSYTTEEGKAVTGTPVLFTATILKGASNREGAIEFVRFLLSQGGQKILSDYGLRQAPVYIVGDESLVPGALRATIAGRQP